MIKNFKRIFNLFLQYTKNIGKKIQTTLPFKKIWEQDKNAAFKNVDDFYYYLYEDIIKLEIGTDLHRFEKEMREIMCEVRMDTAFSTGFVIPAIRCVGSERIQENEIKVFVNGNELYSKFLIAKKDDVKKEIKEILLDLFHNNLYDIMTNEIVEKYIETVRYRNCSLVYDICYCLSTTEIKYILVDILNSGKSIKNIAKIFEQISEYIFITKSENFPKLQELSNKIINNM